MTNHTPKQSASYLLSKLSEKSFIKDDDKSIENLIIEHQQKEKLPLYIKVLVGVGAIIASLCFLGFIKTFLKIDTHSEYMIWGAGFTLLAVLLFILKNNRSTIMSSFLIQSSFTLIVIGKILFTYGMFEIFNSGWATTLGLLIITAITYPFYKAPIERTLSIFAILCSVLINILVGKDILTLVELLFNVFMLAQILCVGILIYNIKINPTYKPIIYALLLSLSIGALCITSHSEFGRHGYKEIINPLFINLLFSGTLIATIAWVSGGINKIKSSTPLIIACLGSAVLGAVSASGIIFSIILMVIGYAKHERNILGMGTLLLPIFLIYYYFNLDILLIEKSGILIGSGIILLIGYLYTNRLIRNKGDAL